MKSLHLSDFYKNLSLIGNNIKENFYKVYAVCYNNLDKIVIKYILIKKEDLL